MGFRCIRFRSGQSEQAQWGVVHDDAIAVLGEHYQTLAELLRDGGKSLEQARAGSPTVDLAEVEVLSPVTTPAKLFCQGLNYASHRAEVGVGREAKQNLIFGKDDSALCGPTTDIIRPPECEMLDYEAELGLVFSRDITSAVTVTDDNLGDYIAGLVICDDVSARDLQFGAGFLQWFRGKGARTFCPTGPYLYLLDPGEATALYDLEVKLWVNGELRQDANTDQLIFRPPETLTDLSRSFDMRVGDCLLTGTPGGVIIHAGPEMAKIITTTLFNDNERQSAMVAHEREQGVRYLQKGDVIEITIRSPDGKIDLGRQRNVIAS